MQCMDLIISGRNLPEPLCGQRLPARLHDARNLSLESERTEAETADCLRISDFGAFRQWLGISEDLRSISERLCANLGRWLPLFRSSEGDGSKGTNMLAGLVRLEEGLASLDPSAHQPTQVRKLIGVNDDELRSTTALAAIVLKPATGLATINPMRWLRKRRPAHGFGC